ncbi:uncharacterized protein LOC115889623 [Sitophilus oryzae]|uniref:Uncharacterized protein LOC115889623 n=1 Tax=Sitophilus oryzae TaxID=7048 RepID=A0A6J2YQI0_SITOR|nr:uncharacterized protein LOC115889623 [Sitophilus oryzae]
MPDVIISLTSSDEEENIEPPPPKKSKPTLFLSECTLTVVSGNKKKKKPTSENITTVTLDSDDDDSLGKGVTKVSNETELIPRSKQNDTSKSVNNVDLTILSDDEDIPPANESTLPSNTTENGENENSNNNETLKVSDTVSIPDSDSETEAVNGTECNNKSSPDSKNESIIVNDSEEETEKENPSLNQITEKITDSVSNPEDAQEAPLDDTQKTPPDDAQETPPDDAQEIPSGDAQQTPPDDAQETPSDDAQETAVDDTQKIALDDGIPETPPESSDETDPKSLFNKFLKLVEEKIADSQYVEALPKKLPIIKKYFDKSKDYVNENSFKTLLTDSVQSISKAKNSNGTNLAIVAFHKICKILKANIAQTTIIVEEENLPKVKMLERTIALLKKRIKKLETTEVNFEEDNNSAYIQLDRYQNRLNKVYKKYCQYIKRNPYSGRATHDKITFVTSNYNEINQAISKKYNNSLHFPNYYELEQFIKKTVTKHKLNLNDDEVKVESRKCLKTLGSILQKKRRQDLYDSHLDFIEFSEDPATKDPSLESVLKKSLVEGEQKIKELCQKYVDMAERGEDKVSTDQGSHSESEEKKNEKSDHEDINKIENST